MKIRTITGFFRLKPAQLEKQIITLSRDLSFIKQAIESAGYPVQTLRLCSQPWQEYFETRSQIISLVKEIRNACRETGIDFFNIGAVKKRDLIRLIPELLYSSSLLFTSVKGELDSFPNSEILSIVPNIIKEIAEIEDDGFANLRFSIHFNLKPGTPFFPSSYHKGESDFFAIGCECSDLLSIAFSKTKDIRVAKEILTDLFKKTFLDIERLIRGLNLPILYGGIDPSIAPSVVPEESIAYAFEKLGLGRFGEMGTLSIAQMVTSAIEKLPLTRCGFSGLMLPVLEDYGIAKRNSEGFLNLQKLLLYSAVCGTGLDTIPLPGDVSEKKLFALILDVASLSFKLSKPLSARLMPIPNKKAGDFTDFQFEYFVNSRVMEI